MENETQNRQVDQTPVTSPSTPQNVPPAPKSKLPLILGGLLLLLLVGGGAYYLGAKNNQPNASLTTQAPTTAQPSSTQIETSTPTVATKNTTWQNVSFQIKKETAVSGNETIIVSMQIPSDWSMQTVNKTTSNSMIKNCADYAVTSGDKATTLTISPICTGWAATYKTWPSDAVVIKDEGKVGNDNHTAAVVRYSGLHTNTFIYSEGFKDQNQIQDALMVYYGNNFIPTNVSVNTTNVAPDTKTTDQIVSSIKAQ